MIVIAVVKLISSAIVVSIIFTKWKYQKSWDIICWRPTAVKDVKANTAVGVDIWMEHSETKAIRYRGKKKHLYVRKGAEVTNGFRTKGGGEESQNRTGQKCTAYELVRRQFFNSIKV